jgi:hypothetical protein
MRMHTRRVQLRRTRLGFALFSASSVLNHGPFTFTTPAHRHDAAHNRKLPDERRAPADRVWAENWIWLRSHPARLLGLDFLSSASPPDTALQRGERREVTCPRSCRKNSAFRQIHDSDHTGAAGLSCSHSRREKEPKRGCDLPEKKKGPPGRRRILVLDGRW